MSEPKGVEGIGKLSPEPLSECEVCKACGLSDHNVMDTGHAFVPQAPEDAPHNPVRETREFRRKLAAISERERRCKGCGQPIHKHFGLLLFCPIEDSEPQGTALTRVFEDGQ